MNKALLILDIDETLLFASRERLDYNEDFMVFDYHIYLLPMLRYFLEEVKKNYLLAIWSSAGDKYVNKVVEVSLLSEFNFEFIWGQSRATYRRNFDLDEMRIYGAHINHYHFVKPLKKVKSFGFRLDRVFNY